LKMCRERLRIAVTASIYNTVAIRHLELIEGFKLIVLDEVHHAAGDGVEAVRDRNEVREDIGGVSGKGGGGATLDRLLYAYQALRGFG